jgi:hypothetical protein
MQFHGAAKTKVEATRTCHRALAEMSRSTENIRAGKCLIGANFKCEISLSYAPSPSPLPPGERVFDRHPFHLPPGEKVLDQSPSQLPLKEKVFKSPSLDGREKGEGDNPVKSHAR